MPIRAVKPQLRTQTFLPMSTGPTGIYRSTTLPDKIGDKNGFN